MLCIRLGPENVKLNGSDMVMAKFVHYEQLVYKLFWYLMLQPRIGDADNLLAIECRRRGFADL